MDDAQRRAPIQIDLRSDSLTVDLGDVIEVHTTPCALAGYQWTVRCPPEISCRHISTIARSALGAGPVEVYHLQSTKIGEYLVVFQLRRPWEDDAVERRTLRIHCRLEETESQ